MLSDSAATGTRAESSDLASLKPEATADADLLATISPTPRASTPEETEIVMEVSLPGTPAACGDSSSDVQMSSGTGSDNSSSMRQSSGAGIRERNVNSDSSGSLFRSNRPVHQDQSRTRLERFHAAQPWGESAFVQALRRRPSTNCTSRLEELAGSSSASEKGFVMREHRLSKEKSGCSRRGSIEVESSLLQKLAPDAGEGENTFRMFPQSEEQDRVSAPVSADMANRLTFFVSQLRAQCLATPGKLDQALEKKTHAFQKADVSSAMFNSHPLHAVASKRIFQLSLLGFGIAAFAYVAMYLSIFLAEYRMGQHPAEPPRFLRFKVWKLRGQGQVTEQIVSKIRFGHLEDGKLRPMGNIINVTDSELIVSILDSHPLVNGWWLETSADGVENDPSSFEFSQTDGDWNSTHVHWIGSGRLDVHLEDAREQIVKFDDERQAHYFWLHGLITIYFNSGIFYTAVALSGAFFESTKLARPLIIQALWPEAIFMYVYSGIRPGRYLDHTILRVCMLLGIVIREKNLVDYLLLYGLLNCIHLLQLRLSTMDILTTSGFFGYLFIFLAAVVSRGRRWYVLWRSRSMVVRDKQFYDEIYQSIMVEPKNYDQLCRLTQVVSDMSAEIKTICLQTTGTRSAGPLEVVRNGVTEEMLSPRISSTVETFDALAASPSHRSGVQGFSSEAFGRTESSEFLRTDSFGFGRTESVDFARTESFGFGRTDSFGVQSVIDIDIGAQNNKEISFFQTLFKRRFMKSPVKRVRSVDQLYTRAICAQVPFIEKTLELARLLEVYMFMSKLEKGFVPCTTVWESPDLVAQVCRNGLKSTSRSMEKIYRTYEGDVSKLCDINRQMLVFESLSGLTEFLLKLHEDSEVNLVRIKNRMDPQYNAWTTYGYRDVNVNLCVSTSETRMLGCDTHVCELQLVLRTFAEARRKNGHSKYVVFRDFRGE